MDSSSSFANFNPLNTDRVLANHNLREGVISRLRDFQGSAQSLASARVPVLIGVDSSIVGRLLSIQTLGRVLLTPAATLRDPGPPVLGDDPLYLQQQVV